MVGILKAFKDDIARALEERRQADEADENAKQDRINKIAEDISKGIEFAWAKVEDPEKIKLDQGKKDYLLFKIPLSVGANNSEIVVAMKRIESEENESSDDLSIMLETDSGSVNVKIFKKIIEGGELK